MAQIQKLESKLKPLTRRKIVKFQIMVYCFMNNHFLSDSDMECLTVLTLQGKVELSDFCYDLSTNHSWIFKTAQSVRNCLSKLERMGLIVKTGKSKKHVELNPNTKIDSSDELLIVYKFVTSKQFKVKS